MTFSVRPVGLAGALLSLAACSTEVSPGGQAAPKVASPTSSDAAAPACTGVPGEALAVVGPGCGVAVVPAAGDAWTVRSLEENAEAPSVAASLATPAPCLTRQCRISGGPLGEGASAALVILVGVPSPDSELIEDLWLVVDGGAPVDLWVEPTVDGDGTALGPAHELWPHLCEQRVALLPRARLDDGSAGEAEPQTLGAARWLDGAQTDQLPAASSCRAAELERP